MLISSDPRPAGSGSFRFDDIPGWNERGRQFQAEILVAEWLQLYEGADQGPLSRRPAEEWMRAFLKLGYFEATVHISSTIAGGSVESGAVVLDKDIPQPTELPNLYRVSIPEHACRFSWREGSDGDVAHWLRQLHLDSTKLEKVWRCASLVHVFGKITSTSSVEPGSEAEAVLPSGSSSLVEWIIAPVEVRQLELIPFVRTEHLLDPSQAHPFREVDRPFSSELAGLLRR